LSEEFDLICFCKSTLAIRQMPLHMIKPFSANIHCSIPFKSNASIGTFFIRWCKWPLHASHVSCGQK